MVMCATLRIALSESLAESLDACEGGGDGSLFFWETQGESDFWNTQTLEKWELN